MTFSLILTVLNEAGGISRLLDSVLAQTLQPSEIVVVDGGSNDGTQGIISAYMDRLPLRLLALPGANISQGRNAAIYNARHDIILVTDAGVRLDPGWTQALAGPLLDAQTGVDVVSGFFLPDPQTPFEAAMGATVLPALEEIQPEKFLPSSRTVAFRKAAWEAVGGYPEWLDYSEDLVFDMRLKEQGCCFLFAPRALVYFRPRSSLRAFYLQYYRYARGDGKADLWRKRHAVRYGAYAVVPVLAAWAWRRRRVGIGKAVLALVVIAGAGYCRRPYMRLLPLLSGLPASEELYALALVPLIRVTGDVAKMAGYPVGRMWRLRHRRKREI